MFLYWLPKLAGVEKFERGKQAIVMAFVDQEVRRLAGKGYSPLRTYRKRGQIAVGVSGGKDSMLLLWLLRERLRRIPISYELIAVTWIRGSMRNRRTGWRHFSHKRGSGTKSSELITVPGRTGRRIAKTHAFFAPG